MQLRVILLSCFVADDYCWHIRASRYIVIITSWWRFQTCDHVVACEHESKCCTCDDFKSVTWCYYSLGCNLRLRRVIQYLILFYTRVIEEHNKKRRPHRQPYKWTKSDLLDTTEFKQTKLCYVRNQWWVWMLRSRKSKIQLVKAASKWDPSTNETWGARQPGGNLKETAADQYNMHSLKVWGHDNYDGSQEKNGFSTNFCTQSYFSTVYIYQLAVSWFYFLRIL